MHGRVQHKKDHGRVQLEATIRVERFDPEGEPPVVTADLSAFGGSDAQPLEPNADGDYRLQEILPVERSNGQAEVIIWIRQRNDAGLHSVKLIHAVTIAPVADAPTLRAGHNIKVRKLLLLK